MRRIILTSACLLSLLVNPLFANAMPANSGHKKPMPLSEVEFNLVAEKWVKTHTAKVTTNLNAVVKSNELANIHNQILSLLNQLADKGDWHITTFNRSQDRSGMERIYVVAEARLDESMLADLNRRAKKLSHEGRTLSIQDITFKPTLAETEKARSDLRKLIYEQIKSEMDEINKVYPTRHYRVHEIDFQPTLQPINRRLSKARAYDMAAEMVASAPAGASLEVSDKVVMSAHVVLADKLPVSGAPE